MDNVSIGLLLKLTGLSSVDFYATAFGIGLIIHFGWLQGLPEFLQPLASPVAMGIFGSLYLLEHFAEKIPGIAVGWNWVHAAVKPLAISVFFTDGCL